MPRKQTLRFQCGHEGCFEFAIYEFQYADERKRLNESYANGKWRCSRHDRPNEVLAAANRRTQLHCTSRKADSGVYWYRDGGTLGFGFESGPGFKAWSADFPEGTTLRITAEVILPGEAG